MKRPATINCEAHTPKQHLLQFDFHIDASWQIQLHQCINRFIRRIDDIHQALMGADLELIARCLVDVRRAQNVETLDARRQRNRAANDCAGALGRFNDFKSGLMTSRV